MRIMFLNGRQFLLVFLMFCGHQSFVMAAPSPPLLLDLASKDWQIFLPDNNENIEDELSKLSAPGKLANWQPQIVPGLVKNYFNWQSNNRLWYRLKFDAGDVFKKPELGLLLGRILSADRVWLNEQFIGNHGKVDQQNIAFISDIHSLRHYPIPAYLLLNKNNTLIIETQSLFTQRGIISGPIGIIQPSLGWRYKFLTEKPIFFAQSGLLVLMFISLLVGLITLLALRRFDAEHFAFVSFFLLAFVTYGMASLVFAQSGYKSEAIERGINCLGLMMCLPLFFYTQALIGGRASKFGLVLMGFTTLCCIALFFATSLQGYLIITLVILFCIAIGISILFINGVPAIRKGNLAVLSVLLGLVLLWISGILYFFANPFDSWLRVDEVGIGLLVLSLLVGYVLRLMGMQNQLRKMSSKLINISEQERKHLARELHDGINQRLATVRLRLQMHASRTQQIELQPLSNELLIAMEEMDRLVQGLQPFNLERHSLAQAMKLEAGGLNTVKGFNVQVVAEDLEIPKKLAQHLYRIFQESVQNALKHANADQIKVKFYRKRNRLTLSIEDDGEGFDSIDSQENRVGIGMISLRERIALIGGVLHIESHKGQGTQIFVQVDIE